MHPLNPALTSKPWRRGDRTQVARKPHHHNVVNLRPWGPGAWSTNVPPYMPLPRIPVTGDVLVLKGNHRFRVHHIEMGQNFTVAYVEPAR